MVVANEQTVLLLVLLLAHHRVRQVLRNSLSAEAYISDLLRLVLAAPALVLNRRLLACMQPLEDSETPEGLRLAVLKVEVRGSSQQRKVVCSELVQRCVGNDHHHDLPHVWK